MGQGPNDTFRYTCSHKTPVRCMYSFAREIMQGKALSIEFEALSGGAQTAVQYRTHRIDVSRICKLHIHLCSLSVLYRYCSESRLCVKYIARRLVSFACLFSGESPHAPSPSNNTFARSLRLTYSAAIGWPIRTSTLHTHSVYSSYTRTIQQYNNVVTLGLFLGVEQRTEGLDRQTILYGLNSPRILH